MGNKLKNTIKEIELRSLAVAVLGIALVVFVANLAYKTIPGSSAWSPVPTSIDTISPTPWGNIQPATDMIFSDLMQLTGPDFEFDNNTEVTTDIYGDNIVFYSPNFDDSNRRILIYNIKTQEIKELETPWGLPFRNRGNPRIYENKIVLEDGGNIFLYDISTIPHEMIPVTNDIVTDECGRGPNIQPDIYGDWVVWAHGVCSAEFIVYNIFAKNIVTGEVRHLNEFNYTQMLPRIFKNKVVWEDTRHAYFPVDGPERYEKCHSSSGRQCRDIYMHDLGTGITKRLTPEYSSQILPYIYEDTIAWYDDRNYEWTWANQENVNKKDIYIYDIGVDNITDLITLPREGYSYMATQEENGPGIWEDFIVYSISFDIDNPLYPLLSEIYLYDTKTDKEYKPVKENIEWYQTSRVDPVIAGFYPYFNIAWAQFGNGRSGGLNIFMLEGRVL